MRHGAVPDCAPTTISPGDGRSNTGSGTLRHLRHPRIRCALLLVAVIFGAVHLFQERLLPRLYYTLIAEPDEARWRGRSVWLPHYRSDSPAVQLEGVLDNLSGLTYDPDRDRLWAVTNSPTVLLLLSKRGDVEARYELAGFHDVEAVTYLGANLLLLSEERRGTQVMVTVPDAVGPIQRADHLLLALNEPAEDNDGIEGSAYDVAGDRLFLVKERNPMRLLEYSGLRASLARGQLPALVDRSDWLNPGVFGTDLSSIDFDAGSGHLLLLSDESKLLFELCREGSLVSFHALTDDAIGIDVPQAEGVALDAEGNLYVVSEPNLFYHFTRISPKPAPSA